MAGGGGWYDFTVRKGAHMGSLHSEEWTGRWGTVGVALHLGQGSCSLVPPSQVCSPLPAQPVLSPILSWRICARSSENGHQVAGGPQR